MLAVVITGPPGAGKTSILGALVDALSDDDVPHAAIDVEMLTWAHPALTDEERTRQLATACALYRAAGHRLLLIAETLETDHDVAQLQDAASADEYFLVRLHAQPATLVQRIITREPEGWSGLPELVEHTQQLALSMPALQGVDLVLCTEGQRPEAVAASIRAAVADRLVR